jgi:peptidyl-prolyl cis-trans isomerase A (cyclophilin A)
MKQVFLALLLPCALLAQAPPATKTGTAPKAAAPAKAAPPVAARPNLLVPSSVKGKAPDSYKVKFTTTKGDVIIQVTRSWAPIGADRFYNLVRAGFFTDAAFFRVIAGFMAQFGMSARPDVSRAWADANIIDDPVTHSNLRGTVTFAQTSQPNTRSTQFFINYGNNARLDASHFSPFGEVIEGMTVVDQLYSGYGDGPPGGNGPDQDSIRSLGKSYLDKNFPKLDRIVSATIVPDTPPAAPAPAAATPGAATKK